MTALSDLAQQAAIRLRQDAMIAGSGQSEDAPTETRQCETHGEYTSVGRHLARLNYTRWSRCPVCAAADEAAMKAKHEREAAEERAARLVKMLKLSGMPKRFHGKDFAGYQAEAPEQVAALTICREYAEGIASHVKTGASLILSGKPGTGKSHLAAAVMHAAMDGGRRTVQYVTCMDLVRAVRATWRRDSERTDDDVLRLFGEEVDLLVIDEIGVQYGTEGEQTVVFDVLDRRYREMRPTILISNAGREQFKAYVGDRVYDRLREVAKWVPFDWDSYRPQARAAARGEA